MDPMQLLMMQQMMRQRPGGMFGSGMPMQQPAMQPAPTQGQLPPTDPAQQPDQQQHHGHGLGGLLPYLGFGLLGGSLLGGGNISPLFGLAGILGHKAKLF